jgi:S1-C subfamily serine protease
VSWFARVLRLLPLLAVLAAACTAGEGSQGASGESGGGRGPGEPFARQVGTLDPHAGTGAELLAWATSSDPTLREYLAEHPDPDLLFAIGPRHLKLIYLGEDRVITFVRADLAGPSRAHPRQPIPEPFLAQLPAVFQAVVRRGRGEGEPGAPALAVSTCFAVRPDGWLLTAHHAIDGARRVRVRLGDGRDLEARVAREDPEHDLALLRVDAEGIEFLPLAHPRALRTGARIFTVGFPAVTLLGRDPKYAEGVVSSVGATASSAAMQLSIPILPGNSGGPVLDERGQVLGILTETAAPHRFLAATGALPQGVSFATRVEFARPLLDAPPPSGDAAPTRDAAIARALGAVCRVDASL